MSAGNSQTSEHGESNVCQTTSFQELHETSDGTSNDAEVSADDDDNLHKLHDLERSIGAVLLKLESTLHVSTSAITELVHELEFVFGAVSTPIIRSTLDDVLQKHSCPIDETIKQELADSICKNFPLSSAVRTGGPFSTDYRRKQYFDKHFSVIKPVEYILDQRDNTHFSMSLCFTL